MMLFAVASLGFVGWFGYLSFSGGALSDSIYDRVMYSTDEIISEINMPVLQVMAAAMLVIAWPKKWRFKTPPAQEAVPVEQAT